MTFATIVVLRGLASPDSPLLLSSMHWSASSPRCWAMPNWRKPCQPSVPSKLSSPMPLVTTCFRPTVPPKGSVPSSWL